MPTATNNRDVFSEKLPFLRCMPAIMNTLNPDKLTRKPDSFE